MTAIHAQTTDKTLSAMRALIVTDDPLLAGRLRAEPLAPASPGFAELFSAACASQVTGAEAYHLAIEFICEGYLLHYGASRLLEPGTAELDLLAGDYMYARGLSSIARLGDLDCIRMLADLVSICSFTHCERLDPGAALAAWSATVLALALHATGNQTANGDTERSTSPAAAVAAMKKSFWEKSPVAADAWAELLGDGAPDAAVTLRGLISEIYSSPEGFTSGAAT